MNGFIQRFLSSFEPLVVSVDNARNSPLSLGYVIWDADWLLEGEVLSKWIDTLQTIVDKLASFGCNLDDESKRKTSMALDSYLFALAHICKERRKEAKKYNKKIKPSYSYSSWKKLMSSPGEEDFFKANLFLLDGVLSQVNANELIAEFDILESVNSSVESVKYILYEKKKHLVKKDEFGFEDDSLWQKEIAKFSENITKKTVVPSDNKYGIPNSVLFIGLKDVIKCMITEKYIVEALQEIERKDDLQHPSDFSNQDSTPSDSVTKKPSSVNIGMEFEEWCKDILTKQGWTAIGTSASGDKGVDIIATKRGLKVAIQCKNWSGKVGTSAVQEIFTGASLYEADLAIVVSNSKPTDQAFEIANKLGVLFILAEDLSEIEIIAMKNILSKSKK